MKTVLPSARGRESPVLVLVLLSRGRLREEGVAFRSGTAQPESVDQAADDRRDVQQGQGVDEGRLRTGNDRIVGDEQHRGPREPEKADQGRDERLPDALAVVPAAKVKDDG